MDKYEMIKEAVNIESPNIHEILLARERSGSKITYEGLIYSLSLYKYNLGIELETTDISVSNMLKVVFPNRPINSSKVCTWLLGKYGLKQCGNCLEVLWFEDFNKNKSKLFGINTYCKICHSKTNAVTQNARQSKYRSNKLRRTPNWVDLEAIGKFYKNCPNGMHVDHIIPLQGKLVSGLHVINNLQYLSASENSSKCNKFTID